MNPLVSILIPAYNSEKWINKTIQSAISQTWKNKEIIVIDDGSSDDTFTVAKQYVSKDLKVISQENRGACVARNRALSIAQGEYIQWLDADDLLAPDKIEIQLSACKDGAESRILHSGSWGYFYYRISQTKFNRNKLWQDLFPSEWLQIHLGDGVFIPTHSWLVSRRLTELAGTWDTRLKRNQDGEYFCRVVANSELVKFHDGAKSFYRKGNIFSISMSTSKAILESLDLSNNLCVDYLLNLENSEISRKACSKFLQRFINKLNQTEKEIILKNQKRLVELGGKVVRPNQSQKFTVIKLILGVNTAHTLKKWLWNLETFFRKNIDKCFAYLLGEKN